MIRNVRVLDVREGTLSAPVDVAEQGGVLDAITPAGGPHPESMDRLDGGGLTMIPGLIDCHTHILSPYLSEQKGIPGLWSLGQMRRNMEAALAAGVVCVRDLLGPIKIIMRWKRKIESGQIPGPDIVAGGAVLSCRDGYPEFIRPVPFPLSALVGQPKMNLETPKKAAAMVRYQHRCGAEVAKVGFTSYNREFDHEARMPTIRDEVFDAVCETAHELGMKVSVHHNWSEDLARILRADIDSLEHMVYEPDISSELLDIIKSKGIVVVPTMTVTENMARFEEKLGFLRSDRARELFEEPARAHLEYISRTWLDFNDEPYQKVFGVWRANRDRFMKARTVGMRLREAGIPLCAGTDLGAVVSFPGELCYEIMRLHSIGLSRLEALRAATLRAAELVGRADELGEVKPGKRADVVLVDGNPLEDLAALKRVRLVGRNGAWYRPKHDSVPDFFAGFDPIMT